MTRFDRTLTRTGIRLGTSSRVRRCPLGLFLFLAAIFPATQLSAQLKPFSTFLGGGETIIQSATDASGNIYLLGQTPDSPIAGNGQDVFVMKLPPSANRILYEVYLGGSGADWASALAVDSAGNAYVTGATLSRDFPAAGVGPSGVLPIPFAMKLDGNGDTVYSILFSNGAPAQALGIAVDSTGEAIVTGMASDSTFAATPGAYLNQWSSTVPFVVKLNAAGTKPVFSAVGVGGSYVALDGAGHIFVAGNTQYQSYPTTSGVYQNSFTPSYFCVFPCQIGFASQEQYVTQLSSDGSHLIYSTFLTGSSGATNTGLAVDAQGNAWVTGWTRSSADYPYTGGSSGTSRPGTFTTKLDPAGSRVLVSVQQGGYNQLTTGFTRSLTNASTIALDSTGNVLIAGSFTRPPTGIDLQFATAEPYPVEPPTGSLPNQCLPQTSAVIGENNGYADQSNAAAYAMRLSSKDGSLLDSQVIPGTSLGFVGVSADPQGNVYLNGFTGLPDIPLTDGVIYDSTADARVTKGNFLMRVSFASSKLGCVADAVTSRFVGPVAPGQLLTLYGSEFGPTESLVGAAGGANQVPTSLGGISVTFDGIPAPLLYVSANQINVQVPFEIKQNATTEMQLSYNGTAEGGRVLPVIPVNPSLFVTSYTYQGVCQGGSSNDGFFQALALNADGSVNSCTNPAKAGTAVTLFVNGLGTAAPFQATGIVNTKPTVVYANPAASVGGYQLSITRFIEQPGAISGLGQVELQVPSNVTSETALYLSLSVGGLTAGPFSVGAAQGTPSPVAIYVAP